MDDPTNSASTLAEWGKILGVSGVGGLVMALLTKFTFRKFTEEDAAQQRAGGESDIIKQMREEVDRLAGINEKLSLKVAELQDQVIALRGENAELKQEVQTLKKNTNGGGNAGQ